MHKKSIADGFEGVRVIDKYDYVDFDSLPYIYVNKIVTGFGAQTFRYCRKLKKIDVDENNSFFTSVEGVLYDKSKEVLICYPANRIGSQFVVPDTVRRIDSFAFSGAHKLRKVILNEGLVEIGDCAFEGCSGIKEIRLPESLEEIGYVAFQGCSQIRDFHIPANAVCRELPALPEHLNSISVSPENSEYVVADNVLYTKDMKTLIRVPGNYSKEIFSIPVTVTRIEKSSFSGCKMISKVIVHEGVKSIGDFAFAYMEGAQVVVISEFLYKNSGKNSSFSLSDATFKTYEESSALYIENNNDMYISGDSLDLNGYLFMSYSSKDEIIMRKIKEQFEKLGVRCWIAPDSIPIGSDYTEVLVDAIENCRAFVLVLSANSQNSVWVPKELDIALSAKKNVFPIHVDSSLLNAKMRFRLSNTQIAECSNNISTDISDVIKKIKDLL